MRLFYYSEKRINNSFHGKGLAALLICGLSLGACSTRSVYEAPAVYSFKGKSMVPPPGMVYVPSGTIMYKSSPDDDGKTRRVSLSPFFIDATEVTNYQYRQFINWVADSIIVTDYLKDESYFLPPEKQNPQFVNKQIDWSKLDHEKTPLWLSTDANIQSKIAGTLVLEKNGRRVLNSQLLKYSFTYPKAGGNSNEFVTEKISIVPDNTVWATDFPNSQMGFMVANYGEHKSYDNYPVVGVTWKQARAYADWRGKSAANLIQKNAYLKAYQLTYSLPTEAQWQYAASGVRNPEDSENINTLMAYKGKKGEGSEKLLVNFKQGEGNYTLDGSTFTLPVKSYSANGFGLYNMSGNVAEWTLDAFSPSAVEFVHDLNPVLLYDANDTDADAMKRKVVRGGSWKDNAELLNVDTRNYEIQDMAHSYIGFRCVMPAPELLSDQVRTRKSMSAKRTKKTGRANRPVENVTTKAER